MDILNNILAVAAHEDGVLLYDISSPSNPGFITSIDTNNAWTVYMENSTIFIGDESELILYSLNEINNQVDYMLTLDMPNSIKDIVGDNYGTLYVALGTDGVMALNLGTDFTPSIIDTHNTTSLANRLDMLDGKVAVSDWDDVEVLNWNLSSESLVKVGYKNTTRRTMAIATKDNFIFSAEWNSVQVFEYGEIEGADLDLNTYELNFPYVEIGNSYTMPFEVTNNGNSVLEFGNIFTTNLEFSVSDFTSLMPGESQIIDVTYTATENNASGGLRIWSNDEDESDIVCETNGNIDGANIGVAAPDFELEIVANGEGAYRLSDHLGEIVVLAFFAPS